MRPRSEFEAVTVVKLVVVGIKDKKNKRDGRKNPSPGPAGQPATFDTPKRE
jgi:hypothetical protein